MFIYYRQFKLYLVGHKSGCPTRLLNQFNNANKNKFNKIEPNLLANINPLQFAFLKIKCNNININLNLWGTKGQERNMKSYTKHKNGLIYVYDISNPLSFNKVNQCYDSTKKLIKEKNVIFLIGHQKSRSDKRRVNTNTAQVNI